MTVMQQTDDKHADDPRPNPPVEPDAFACCGNDCGDACVWTIYNWQRKVYERELEAWQIRQLEREE